jgi:WD40 repeat protein
VTLVLVTGSAGVGKSTLLREMVLRVSSGVDVAIHARNCTANDIAARVADAMSVGFTAADDESRAAAGRELLARRVAELPGRVRARPLIVVDSLDEARQHARAVARFLRVLSADGGADVVVAVRTGHGDLTRLLRPASTVDLDSDAFFDPADVRDFIDRVIAGEAPGLSTAQRAAAVSAIVVAAGRNFLIAGLLALARASTPHERWDPGTMPANVADAMRLFIDRLPDPERAWSMLLPPAMAEGEGWPVSLWAPAVSALSGRRCTAEEIELFRTSAVEYLIEQESHGADTAVRPYHDALGATVLLERAQGRAGRAAGETIVQHRDHGLLTGVLLDHLAHHGLAQAAGYVRHHLPAHALRGGRLAELLDDPAVVCLLDPGRLHAALAQDAELRDSPLGRCHALTVHLLGDDPDDNAALLHLAALYQGHRELATRIAAAHPGMPFNVLGVAARSFAATAATNGHSDWVTAVCAFPHGGSWRIASASADQTVKLWDPASPAHTARDTLYGHTDCVRDVTWFDDAGTDMLASAGDDCTLRVWRASGDRMELWRTLVGHTDWVRAVRAYAGPEGWRLASASDDGTVRLWAVDGSDQPLRTFTGHRGWVIALALVRTDAGWRMISGGVDQTIRVWDPDADQEEPLVVCCGHTDCVRAITTLAAPDGWQIVSAGDDRKVRFWNLATGEQLRQLPEHPRSIRALSLLPGHVLTGSMDQRVRMWPLSDTGDQPQRTFVGHNDWVRSITTWCADGTARMATGSDDGTVRVWDTAGAGASHVFRQDTSWIRAVCTLHTDGGPLLAAGGTDHAVRLLRLSAGELSTVTVLAGHDNWVRSLAALRRPDGWRLISAGDDGQVHLWNPSAPGAPERTFSGHDGPVRAVHVFDTPDGPRLASVGDDRMIHLWRADTGDALWASPAHDDWIRCVTTYRTPNGTRLVTGGDDRVIRVWDIDDDRPPRPVAELAGHTNSVRGVCVATYRDAPMLASTSDDGTLRLWDPEANGRPRHSIEAHKASGLAVTLLDSASGARLATASADQTVKVWDLDGCRRTTIPTMTPTFAVAPVGTDTMVVGNQRGVLLLRLPAGHRPRRSAG